AGGLVGDHLRDVQAREREVGSGVFEGYVRGVVRAGEKVRTRPGEPLHADRQRGPHRLIVGSLPRGQAAGQRDAVQGHIWVVMGAQLNGALLAEDPAAQRGSLHGGRKNAKVLQSRAVHLATCPSRKGVINASTSPGRRVTPTCVVPGSTASCAFGRSSNISTTSGSGEKSRSPKISRGGTGSDRSSSVHPANSGTIPHALAAHPP